MTKKKGSKKEVSGPVTKDQMMDINLIDLTGLNPRGEGSYKDEAFQELKQSMKENGFFVHEPLLVRPAGDRYQLVGGHRRLQAAKELSFEVVPVCIREISDAEVKVLIFLDNLHRKDLAPLEEAQAIKQVLDDGLVTQTELARKMGKSQAYVANRLRLLDAPQELKDLIISQEITPSHVNVLLPFVGYPVFESIMTCLKERVDHNGNYEGPLSVRDLEQDIIGECVNEDDSILDSLDQFPYDIRRFQEFFDFSGCKGCKSIVMKKDYNDKEQRCCMDQGCWSVLLNNAKLKFGEAAAEQKKRLIDNPAEHIRTDEVPYNARKDLRWAVWHDDKEVMAECSSCAKYKLDEDEDPTCLDVDCYDKKEKAWQREKNKKAREEDKQVWALMDEKLSGISGLGEKEMRYVVLELSENVIWSQACKKAYKPWVHLVKKGHEMPGVADIPAGELVYLLLRLIIIQKMSGGDGLASMDQFNRAIEGLGV